MKLRTKLLVLFCPLLLFSVGVVPQLARVAVQDIVEQELVKNGLAAVEAAAANPVLIVAFHSRDELAFMVPLQELQTQTRARAALVLDLDGRVLAHTDVGQRDRLFQDPFTLAARRAATPFYQFMEIDGEPVAAVAAPVWRVRRGDEAFLLLGEENPAARERLGTLRVALPLREALETGAEISIYTFWILTGTSSLVLALVLLFTRQVLRPIRLLSRATERLGRGSLGEEVPVVSTDEIGDLGRHFNQMSHDLAETTVSKDALDRILNNMLDAVIVTDSEGRMRTLNRSALELLDGASDELADQPAVDFFAKEEGELLDPTAGNREARVLPGTGAPISVLVNVSPFAHADGSTGFIISARNIDAWKRAERELEEQKARSMHADRLRSLGEMAAGISHELNQPLMGIRGLAEHVLIALEHGLPLPDEKLRERVTGIVEQSDRMVHIIQHVLRFARDAGKEEHQLVQANEIVQSALDLLGAQLRSRGIGLYCDLDEELPPVSANPFSLEEVVLNLINNARDALEEHYPKSAERAARTRLEVDTRLIQSNNGAPAQVGIAIKDNGPGIPAEVVDRIFDPFFTTKDPDKGTGLGLAISRSIVEDVGGSLQVRSDPGRGTTFTILLPTAATRTESGD